MKEVHDELLKPGFNSFGLGDCKAPKVLGDIVESIAGAIFLDSGRDTAVVWKVSFYTYLVLFFIVSCITRSRCGWLVCSVLKKIRISDLAISLCRYSNLCCIQWLLQKHSQCIQ